MININKISKFTVTEYAYIHTYIHIIYIIFDGVRRGRFAAVWAPMTGILFFREACEGSPPTHVNTE